jgi:hypothetical protein
MAMMAVARAAARQVAVITAWGSIPVARPSGVWLSTTGWTKMM